MVELELVKNKDLPRMPGCQQTICGCAAGTVEKISKLEGKLLAPPKAAWKCLGCEKWISPYIDICPNCGGK